MNRLIAAAAFAAFLFSAPAGAQIPDAYFGDIASQLDVGERAVVSTISGEQIRGRVVGVSRAGIELQRKGENIRLLAQHVRKVERAGDRIWNGAGIGATIGFAIGAVPMATCDPGFMCDNSWQAVLGCGALVGGIGFGIGALGDWLVRPDRLIFDRGTGAARLTVAPLISRARQGVTVRVKF
jgi:hypothetical protein